MPRVSRGLKTQMTGDRRKEKEQARDKDKVPHSSVKSEDTIDQVTVVLVSKEEQQSRGAELRITLTQLKHLSGSVDQLEHLLLEWLGHTDMGHGVLVLPAVTGTYSDQ